jgi:hypothetical protein
MAIANQDMSINQAFLPPCVLSAPAAAASLSSSSLSSLLLLRLSLSAWSLPRTLPPSLPPPLHSPPSPSLPFLHPRVRSLLLRSLAAPLLCSALVLVPVLALSSSTLHSPGIVYTASLVSLRPPRIPSPIPLLSFSAFLGLVPLSRRATLLSGAWVIHWPCP